MKTNLFRISLFSALAATSVWAQKSTSVTPGYIVTDLGTLRGGNFSQATFVGNNSLITGISTAPDGSQHSVIWYRGWIGDFGANLLGGPNSGVFGANERGQVLGQGESSDKDPNNENFCGYGTGLKCLPFLWQDGVPTPLPLLGGNNGTVGSINNRGEAVGMVENGVRDPDCPSKPALNGTGPQVLDFEAVIWGPRPAEIRELPPLPGDTVGMAFWINDNGQVVGATGSCANTTLPGLAAGAHAVLWDKDGSVHDLGNLGGTANPALLGVGNVAFAINNQGQVVGTSALSGNTVHHAFLWTKEAGMQDLGTFPGDAVSAGLAINEVGLVVGASIDGMGNPRAMIWQNGAPSDLNTLVPTDTALYLLSSFGVNDAGEIVGFGVQKDTPNNLHAFLATPSTTGDDYPDIHSSAARRVISPISFPENARKLFRRGTGIVGR